MKVRLDSIKYSWRDIFPSIHVASKNHYDCLFDVIDLRCCVMQQVLVGALDVQRAEKAYQLETSSASIYKIDPAYDRYIEFLKVLRTARNHAQEQNCDEDVFFTATRDRLSSIWWVKAASLREDINGPVYGATKRSDAIARYASHYFSEFADDMAVVLGEPTKGRIFACCVLVKAYQYARVYGKESDVKAVPMTAANARKHLKAISASAKALHDLLRAHGKSELFALVTAVQKSEFEKLRVEMQSLRQSPEGLIELDESEMSYAVGDGPTNWAKLATHLAFLSRAAEDSLKRIPGGQGRQANAANNYTALCMIADGWDSCFGENPSASEGARFMKIVDYCLLLFSKNGIDIKAGLKYWKRTRSTLESRSGQYHFNSDFFETGRP